MAIPTGINVNKNKRVEKMTEEEVKALIQELRDEIPAIVQKLHEEAEEESGSKQNYGCRDAALGEEKQDEDYREAKHHLQTALSLPTPRGLWTRRYFPVSR